MSRCVRVERRLCCFSRSLSCARPCASSPRLEPWPRASASASVSAASRSTVATCASSSAASTRLAAAIRQAPTSTSVRGDPQHLGPTQPAGLVEREPARPPDVRLRGAGGERGSGRVHAVAADEHLGHRVGRRRHQGDRTAAGPDRRQHVLQRGRAQDPDRAQRRLLDRLEQRVRRTPGQVGALQPVGVLDDDDLPSTGGGRQHRAADEVTDVVGEVVQPGRSHDLDVRDAVPSRTVRHAWHWPQPGSDAWRRCTAARPRRRARRCCDRIRAAR